MITVCTQTSVAIPLASGILLRLSFTVRAVSWPVTSVARSAALSSSCRPVAGARTIPAIIFVGPPRIVRPGASVTRTVSFPVWRDGSPWPLVVCIPHRSAIGSTSTLCRWFSHCDLCTCRVVRTSNGSFFLAVSLLGCFYRGKETTTDKYIADTGVLGRFTA